MQFEESKHAYREAEARLRGFLFGDGTYTSGRLRGEEARREATAELRRMRAAFDETLDLARKYAERAVAAEERLDHSVKTRSRRPRRA